MTQISGPTALRADPAALENAADYKADVIVTLCPMCQLNLDAYQGNINQHFGTDYHIPILYFTQLIGLAFGVDGQGAGLRQGVRHAPAGAGQDRGRRSAGGGRAQEATLHKGAAHAAHAGAGG